MKNEDDVEEDVENEDDLEDEDDHWNDLEDEDDLGNEERMTLRLKLLRKMMIFIMKTKEDVENN